MAHSRVGQEPEPVPEREREKRVAGAKERQKIAGQLFLFAPYATKHNFQLPFSQRVAHFTLVLLSVYPGIYLRENYLRGSLALDSL